ncbi:MAG: aldo/keto reductase [Bacillota bacterium]|nr:aldo/keto reductase [Bacillota bacterium]
MKKLGFGYMRLPLMDKNEPTSFDYQILNQLVDTFMAKGFTYFDTALTYHGGHSEEALRKSLVERYPRDQFVIATKLPPRVLKTAAEQEEIFHSQLERCGVDYFDYYLVHNLGVSAYAQAEEFGTFDFVRQKKKEGKIRNIGFSFHDTPELLEKILKKHPDMDFVQLQINYLDWENPSIQSRRCYEIVRKYEMPIIVMEPCKGGNLAKVPEEAERLMCQHAPQASVPSWAIRYAAGLEGVFMVLTGMNTMEQVIDNTSYMDDFIPLNAEEEKILHQVVDYIHQDTAIACTTCRYCEEVCQEHIAIPDYFSLYNSAKRAVSDNTSSQHVYYLNLASTHGKAGDCRGCQECETVCPQHLPIANLLKDVSRQFDHVSLPGRS